MNVELTEEDCGAYIASLDIAIVLCEKNIFALRAGDHLRELRSALMNEYSNVSTLKGE